MELGKGDTVDSAKCGSCGTHVERVVLKFCGESQMMEMGRKNHIVSFNSLLIASMLHESFMFIQNSIDSPNIC